MTRPSAQFHRTLAGYFAVSILLLGPSMLRWRQRPLCVTRNEFGFTLGQWGQATDLTWRGFLTEKLPHVVLFALAGLLFYRLTTRFAEEIDALTRGALAAIIGSFCLLYSAGLPWVSPDVFYYIGHGWLQTHYGLDAYRHSISMIADRANDEMLSNVHPWLAQLPATYGPLYEKYSAVLTAASGGSINSALWIFKAGNLFCYLTSAGLLHALASQAAIPAKRAVFLWACNPLSLFCLLTCAHNDIQMILALLAALFFLDRRRAILCGALLATAVAVKVVALLCLPVFGVCWLRRARQPGRVRAGAWFAAGFGVVLVAAYQLYPGSFARNIAIVGSGWQILRNSLPFALDWLLSFVPGAAVIPWRAALSAAFLGALAWVSFKQFRDSRPQGIEVVCASLYLTLGAYFLIAAPAVMEWYLTWLIAPALLAGRKDYERSITLLSCFYLCLVVFNVRGGAAGEHAAGLLLYLFLAWALLSRRTDPASGYPSVEDRGLKVRTRADTTALPTHLRRH